MAKLEHIDLKNMTNSDLEDLDFAIHTEMAYREIERGEYVEMDAEEFLKKLKSGRL